MPATPETERDGSVNWRDQTIFVTGATGFIGGRICERLVEEGAGRVRALVHTIQRAPRIARLPIELWSGDLLERDSLARALGDSAIVIHAGLGIGRAIVRGTENLLQLAISRRVQGFIHLSTAAVYGLTPPPGSETEAARPARTGDPYCDNKMRAEQAVGRAFRRGLPTVILRPSIVYGPYSAWSTRLIEALRRNEVTLIDQGEGACNTTYVDNLVDAIFLALDRDQAQGETFFITDGQAITWGDFIRAHANMLSPDLALPQICKEKVVEHYRMQPGLLLSSLRETRRLLLSSELRRLVLKVPLCKRALDPIWRAIESMPIDRKQRIRALLGNQTNGFQQPTNHVTIPDSVDLATQTGTVFFSIEKARRILGYEPRVRFHDGIKLVEHWLRFANYL